MPNLPSASASPCSYGCGSGDCQRDGCYKVKRRQPPPVECRCSTDRETNNCSIRSGSAGCSRYSRPSNPRAEIPRTYCHTGFGCGCSEREDLLVEGRGPNILEEASGAISRGAAYGRITDDFGRITGAAAALGLDLTNPHHHPLYMILLKISRLVGSPGHRDSIVDIAGYARTLELLLEGR